MCGIFCTVLASFPDTVCNCKKLEENVWPSFCRRGPDFFDQRKVEIRLPSRQNDVTNRINDGTLAVCLSASVLHLRGGNITKQPVQDDNGNLLAWNGEIFSGLKVDDGESDTKALLDNLQRLSNGDDVERIFKTMEVIEGPWGFVYYQAQQQTLWFGRDYFGRRSLLWHRPSSSTDLFAISSVGKREERGVKENFWEEVPADGIYCMDLTKLGSYFIGDDSQEFSAALTKYPWQHPASNEADAMVSRGPKCPLHATFNRELPKNSSSPSSFVKRFERCDVQHENTGDQNLTDVTSVISVVHCNADDTPGDSDDSSSNVALTQHGNVDVPCAVSLQTDTVYGFKECHFNPKLVAHFVDILTEAVKKRVFNLPREKNTADICCHGVCEKTENCTCECCERRQHRKRSKVGILFSGGLDSIVLAALADRCIPAEESIDMINVAFQQKTTTKNETRKRTKKNEQHEKKHDMETVTYNFDVPDRITGRNGIAELKYLNPERSWNFIEVNITLEELQDARSQFISHLVYPQSTVLDDSIGCALWFAARGSGALTCQQCLENITDFHGCCSHLPLYTSPAKVVLVGMGADEQLGGYARHRSRFNKEGWQGLMEEMEMDVLRISERNLGRDDRCISDHGREARYPFLDENVVSFFNSLPVWIKCDPRLDRGVGEKIILRQAAKFIGLTASSELPKRAIQFGSRIAKLESSSEKGGEKCHRLR